MISSEKIVRYRLYAAQAWPSRTAAPYSVFVAIRDYAVATDNPNLAHLCTAALNGDEVAIERITNAIASIDTGPTHAGTPRKVEL